MRITKTITLTLAISLTAISLALASERIVAVNQYAHHPALDEVSLGLKEVLSTDKDIKLVLENSQGSITTSIQVAKHLASLSPDVMVAIATPAGQTMLKARNAKTTLAFAAVTDPKAAGLIGDNIIGVTDNPPVEELLATTLKVLPNIKKIGIIFNAAEVNSVTVAKLMTELAKSKGIEVIEAAVNSTNDIALASKGLVGKVEVIYLPQDNTVVSAVSVIARIASQNKIPLISNDPALVDKGVFLALGCNYKKAGNQLAQMILSNMQGELKTNIVEAKAKELRVNHEVAKALQIKVDGIIQEGEKQ
jgi:putative ABC transport system substrate-binding protein